MLPASSVCLVVPIVPPSQWDSERALQQRAEAVVQAENPPTELANPDVAGN